MFEKKSSEPRISMQDYAIPGPTCIFSYGPVEGEKTGIAVWAAPCYGSHPRILRCYPSIVLSVPVNHGRK